MPRWLSLFLLLAMAAPAGAQEAATLGKLPEVQVLTALKSGDWDDLGDLIGEALDEVDELADERDIKLIKNTVAERPARTRARPSAPTRMNGRLDSTFQKCGTPSSVRWSANW